MACGREQTNGCRDRGHSRCCERRQAVRALAPRTVGQGVVEEEVVAGEVLAGHYFRALAVTGHRTAVAALGESFFDFGTSGAVGAFTESLAVGLDCSSEVIVGMVGLGIHQQDFVFRDGELLRME